MGYWDTSCLAKLFLLEAHSLELRAHVAGGATVVTSDISRMELWVTLRRQEADGNLAKGTAVEDLQRFDTDVEIGKITVLTRHAAIGSEYQSVIETCYSAEPRIHLRTLDAIHLASAQISGESEMVTTDRRLRDAARLFGFTLFPAELQAPAPSV
jgi:predicted nucleic acid-binding protein